jgi:3-oxoacyl-[acyl-carrier protein] reductase
MIGMSCRSAPEVTGEGITLKGMALGWIGTGSFTEEEKTAGVHTPMGRSRTPQEAVLLVAFPASDGAT